MTRSLIQNPFIFITSLFALGIGLNAKIESEFTIYIAIFGFVFSTFFTIFSSYKKSLFQLLTAGFFLILAGQWFTDKYKSKHLIPAEQMNDEFWIFKIEDFQQDSIWSKGIGRVIEIKGNETKFTSKRILIFIRSENNLQRNDVIVASSDLMLFENKNNPGEFDAASYWQSKGVSGTLFLENADYKRIENIGENFVFEFIHQTSSYCRELLNTQLKDESLAIASALILGDKSNLDQETRQSFSNSGAMHVLAVSGLHVGIIMQILMGVGFYFSRYTSRKQVVVGVILLLWLYAFITGMSPSVVRAVFMFSLLGIAQIRGKNYQPLNILFFTAFILLLYNPLYLFDVGFELSYGAMIGIYVFYNSVEKWWQPKNKLLSYFWKGSALGIAAQIFTAPLTLYYFHQFPNYFMLSNLGLMVLSGIALGAGILLLVIGKIPFLNKLVALILTIILLAMLYFLQGIEQLPGAVAKGYDFPLVVVPILTISLSLLFTFSLFSKMWWVSCIVFGVSIFGLSFQRNHQLQNAHICFFNENGAVINVHQNGKNVLFVDSTIADKKISYLMTNYERIFPSNQTSIIKIGDHITRGKIGLLNYKIENERHKINFQIGSKLFSVMRTFYDLPRKKATVIFAPWLEDPKSLRYGAQIFPL